MADLIIQDTTLQAIANAIREKTGSSDGLTPSQMASEVTDKLSAGGGSETLDALIDGSITEIESGVESVRDHAFRGCSNLITAKFPNATSIGTYALQSVSLESVEAPLVTIVASNCFYNSSKLRSIHLPALKEAGQYAFSNCSSLSEVNLPSLTTVKEYAFKKCSNLRKVNLPSLTAIEKSQVFYECSALVEVDIPLLKYALGGQETFAKCTSLESISFPLCEQIGQSMFSGCSNLKNVDLPELTNIGNASAFLNCTSLTRISLPKVTALSSGTFRSCTSLKSVVMPSCFNYIGANCFNGASSLNKIIIATEKTLIPSLSNISAFVGTPIESGDGYIYVKNDKVADCRISTNWATYASQIMPWVATTEELANIDTTLYDKACVGYENDGTEYSYDGTQWTEVIR